MAKDDPVTPMPSMAQRCPICGKPTIARHQPFCSARCTDIDLGRWLKGTYSVPTDGEPSEDAPQGEQREE